MFGVGGGGCTQLNTLQHTQSSIRLYGETNPVTVSGDLSALTCYTLDFTETVGLVTKKEKNCVFVLLFICKWHVAPPSLECPINVCPKPHSSNHPWPLDASALDRHTELLPWFYV